MLSAWTFSLFAVALTGLAIAAVFIYGKRRYEIQLSRYGLTPLRSTSVTLLAVVAVGILVTASGDAGLPDSRATLIIGLWTVLLAVSVNALVGTVGVARCWRGFHPASAVPAGEVSTGPVAVSGTVTDATVADAPVTGREACCWTWSASADDPYAGAETTTKGFRSVGSGQGGVAFALDDGSGPVAVDPTGVTLDIDRRQTVGLDAGESLPRPHTDRISDIEFDHGDTAREYSESIVAPGDTVSVAGWAVHRDGRVVITDSLITTGSLLAVAEQYRAWTLLAALGGISGVLIALWGIAGLL